MSILNKKILYKSTSSMFEGDSFIFGPFADVDEARIHYSARVNTGYLDPGSFDAIYLNNPGDEPVDWEETARVPGTLQGPLRLFSTT